MPQRDTVTYSGQVIQFVTVFTIRYALRVRDVLPRRNRAVKFRQKKLDATKNDASSFDGERTKTTATYGSSRSKAAASSAALITSAIAEQDAQVTSTSRELMNKKMVAANSKYLNFFMEREGRKAVLRDLLAKTK